MRAPLAVVVKGYPRLSETFIAQEIRALERRGIELVIVSLRRPTDRFTHRIHSEIRSPVLYLPEYLHQAPGRVLRAWTKARRLPGYARARAMWLADLARDRSRNRVRRFGQALVLAAEAGRLDSIHAHFLHTPASVARYASAMLGIGWSFSAHAKDVWTTPEWEKREKLADARFGVTCTRANHEHLVALAPAPDLVELVYHGLDHERFPARVPERPRRDGSAPADPVRLLSVGRLVEKKGFDDLLESLAMVSPALSWTLDVVGAGPLESRLRRRAIALGLGERVRWRGSLPHDGVVEHYLRRGWVRPRVADLPRRGPGRAAERADGGPAPRRRMRGDPGFGDPRADRARSQRPARTTGRHRVDGRRARTHHRRSRAAGTAGRGRAPRSVTTRFSFEDGVERIAARLAAPSHPAPDPTGAGDFATHERVA